MSPALYFLRSSESKIVKDLTPYAHPKSENPHVYFEAYGLNGEDLGLYALVNNTLAGAIWCRRVPQNSLPEVSLAILPDFTQEEIDAIMMEQFLQEVSVVHSEISARTYENQALINFYKKFGFEEQEGSELLVKKLTKQEIIRPKDNYDPQRWMD